MTSYANAAHPNLTTNNHPAATPYPGYSHDAFLAQRHSQYLHHMQQSANRWADCYPGDLGAFPNAPYSHFAPSNAHTAYRNGYGYDEATMYRMMANAQPYWPQHAQAQSPHNTPTQPQSTQSGVDDAPTCSAPAAAEAQAQPPTAAQFHETSPASAPSSAAQPCANNNTHSAGQAAGSVSNATASMAMPPPSPSHAKADMARAQDAEAWHALSQADSRAMGARAGAATPQMPPWAGGMSGMAAAPSQQWDPLARVLAFYGVQRQAAVDNSIEFWSEVSRSFFSPSATLRISVPREGPVRGGPAAPTPRGDSADTTGGDGGGSAAGGHAGVQCASLPAAAIPWLLQMCWLCKMVWRTFAPGLVSESRLPGGRSVLTLHGAVDEAFFAGCSLQQHANHCIIFEPDMSISLWAIAVVRHRHVVDAPEPGQPRPAGADALSADVSRNFLSSWLRFIEMTSTLTNEAMGSLQQGVAAPPPRQGPPFAGCASMDTSPSIYSHGSFSQMLGASPWGAHNYAGDYAYDAAAMARRHGESLRTDFDEAAQRAAAAHAAHASLSATMNRSAHSSLGGAPAGSGAKAAAAAGPVASAMTQPSPSTMHPGAPMDCMTCLPKGVRRWNDNGDDESVRGGSEGALLSGERQHRGSQPLKKQQLAQDRTLSGSGPGDYANFHGALPPTWGMQLNSLPPGHSKSSPWANYYKLDTAQDLVCLRPQPNAAKPVPNNTT